MSRSKNGLSASLRLQPGRRGDDHLGAGDRSAGSARRPNLPGSVRSTSGPVEVELGHSSASAHFVLL